MCEIGRDGAVDKGWLVVCWLVGCGIHDVSSRMSLLIISIYHVFRKYSNTDETSTVTGMYVQTY